MVYGWILVTAAWSFAYPLWRPTLEHIRVGLFGFLAYDLVLLVPFVRRVAGRVPPARFIRRL